MRRRLAIAGSVLLVLWCGGFLWFAETLPVAVPDPLPKADGVVVLTGGAERLSTGLALLAEDPMARLLVSGVHRDVGLEQLRGQGLAVPPALAERVDLGHAAANTFENATETAAWVEKHGLRSVRVVTAAYHLPRSMLLLRHAMPGVALIGHPVLTPNVPLQVWWKWPGTAWLLAGEYTKYVIAAATPRFRTVDPGPPLSLGDVLNGVEG